MCMLCLLLWREGWSTPYPHPQSQAVGGDQKKETGYKQLKLDSCDGLLLRDMGRSLIIHAATPPYNKEPAEVLRASVQDDS